MLQQKVVVKGGMSLPYYSVQADIHRSLLHERRTGLELHSLIVHAGTGWCLTQGESFNKHGYGCGSATPIMMPEHMKLLMNIWLVHSDLWWSCKCTWNCAVHNYAGHACFFFTFYCFLFNSEMFTHSVIRIIHYLLSFSLVFFNSNISVFYPI